jgi:hypothetical protein
VIQRSRYAPYLLLGRGLFDVINHEYLDWCLALYELQPKFLKAEQIKPLATRAVAGRRLRECRTATS